MITKTADWSLIIAGMQELKRSKQFINKVMKKIKELDSNNVEDKNR